MVFVALKRRHIMAWNARRIGPTDIRVFYCWRKLATGARPSVVHLETWLTIVPKQQ